MEIPTILPAVGEPVSTDVLNLEALENASIGEILHAQAVLANVATERIADPDTFHDVATYADHEGADWAGFQGSTTQAVPTNDQGSPAGGNADKDISNAEQSLPVAPDKYCDSLPAIGLMLRQVSRFHDATVAHFARYVEVGLKNQRTYFGTPFRDSQFKDSIHYLVETLRISRHAARKIVSRGRYYAHRPGETNEHKDSQPIFPDLAKSLVAGRLPIENADRVITLDSDLTKYTKNTGQPLWRKDEALQVFQPSLVEAGESATPDELSQSKHRWLNQIAHWICPDGPSPAEAAVKQADNELRMREHADGTATYTMHVTSEASIVMKNFMLHQLNFNGSPVKIPDRVLNLLKIFKHSRSEDPTSTAPKPSDDAAADAQQPHVTSSSEDDLGAILGPLETWDTQHDPDDIVAENSEQKPVRASHIDHLEQLTTGQRMGAILVSLMYNMAALDPKILGAKRAHGSLARLVIVQDIETAHHTLGIPKIPPAARRPDGPEGHMPAAMKRNTPDGPKRLKDISPDPDNAFHLNGMDPPENTAWTPYQSEAVNIGSIHPRTAEILVCNSELAGQIWNGPDTVLLEKRAKRLFTVAQRRAILARDKGCQAPGCTIPAVHCAIHHIKEWLNGGTTDETNAVTLCHRHHAAVHNGKWEIRRHDGLIFFQPAPWLDPAQPLLRNIYWNV